MTKMELDKGRFSNTALPSLRLLKDSDLLNVCRWMTSSYILQHSFVVPSAKSLPDDFATSIYAARYFHVLMTDQHRVSFAITVDGRHVGNVGLKEISKTNMTAECFIEIGEKSFRGRGVGQSALTQLLDLAFAKMELLEVSLEVLEFNFPAIKVYDRLGFIAKGKCGWHYDEFGQYWHVVRMSILSEAWSRRKLST